MNIKTVRSALVRTSFIAFNFIVFYSMAIAGLRSSNAPVPESPDDLTDEVHTTDLFTYPYRSGYKMSVTNTEVFGEPTALEEPLAFLSACKNKNPLLPGELRIYQSSYSAMDQSGKSIKLNCDLMPVSEEWLITFLDALPQCLEESTAAIDWDVPESVAVHSVMIYMHKGSNNKLSLHAPARAVDIAKLELTYPEGKRDLVVSLADQAHNPQEDTTVERKFYRAFRECWSKVLVDQYGCSNWSKHNFRGSVGWEDSAHQNHLHLSRPYCPDNANFKGG